ncbi:3153_t:CDS:2 [Entrophospora sp. SA101]|nr:3153_t:CDS:2 [Entrophospora sp. SA101]CAJ0838919.1 1709_t:CDS:2 [Entrophospora sp. SA101]CAJ0888000.1 22336_t:CDS:2 [Entrophospora sp. SA101]
MSNFLTIKRSNDIKYDVIIEVDGHGEEFDLKDDNNELIDKLQNHIIEKFREYIEENIFLTSETIFLSEKFKKLQNYWSDLICAFPSQLLFDNSSREKNFTSLPESAILLLLNRNDFGVDEVNIWKNIINWAISKHSEPTTFSKKSVEAYTTEDFDFLKTKLEKFIPLIRFYTMTSTEFFNSVLPYEQMLSPELFQDLMKFYLVRNYKNTKLQESSADTNYYNKRVVRDDVIDYKKSKRKSKIFKIKL